MRCCAYILNLIVQSGLKSIHESIAKVFGMWCNTWEPPLQCLRSLKNVLIRRKLKQNVCCPLTLDVPTRWNSTYLMLDCALKFVRAFDRLEEEDEHYKLYFYEANGIGKKPIGPPSYLDWENVKTFVKFLSIFYEMTLKSLGPCLSLPIHTSMN